jgi:hypothetical protein
MRWNKESLKSSLQSLLGHKPTDRAPARPPTPGDGRRFEMIRTAMLGQLEEVGLEGYEHVARRIRQAKDVEALWFLRADLMYALSSLRGEAEAARRMSRITPQFNGLLSAGLNSRPSPLGGRATR